MLDKIPIDKAALAAVRKGLAALLEIEPLIAAAMEAGFDVAEQAARHKHYLELSKNLLKIYEPLVSRKTNYDNG